MPLDYAEDHGSPTVTLTEDGPEIERRYRIAWADRNALAAALVGTQDVDYPNHSSYCTRVSIVPVPAKNLGEGSVSSYEMALVTASWTPRPYEPEDLISESIEPTAEFLTLDAALFRWGSGAGTELESGEAPGRLVKGFDYVFTRYQVEDIPAAAVTLIGTVNNAPVRLITPGLRNWIFAAETLLYNPPVLERTLSFIGGAVIRPTWTCNYRYTYNPNWDGAIARGWNWYWRAKTQKYEQLYVAGGGVYKNYLPADYTVI